MDTFRILMVLPSVFTRGWDHFGRKIGPPGGHPPPPPGGGAPPGGGPRAPPGGGTPPSRGGGNPGQKGPPPGVPLFCTPNSCKEITRGEARYRFSTHSPVPCQR